jgi:replicative DNA helicase
MAFAGKKGGRDRERDTNEVLAAAAAAMTASQGNVPPHDLEAERAVLGGVLLDNGALGAVGAVLAASDFYHPSHAVIFEAILALSSRSEPIDVVTLTTELRARERLNTVGGVQYLGELTDTVPTIAHIENHARIVADMAQVRRMIAVAHEIVARGFGERGSADAFLDFAAAKVFEIAQKRSKSTLIPLEQAIQEAFERIEKTLERGARITGIETGFRDLDTLTAGMSPGQLIILAARPAMGKCLAHDAEILLGDGSVASIEQVYHRREASLLTLGEDWKFRATAPSHFVDDGLKPVFRVTTRLGRSVESTLTHPYLTMDGWKRLEEIRVGQKIAVPRRLAVFGDQALRACEVRLLAYLIGDGGLTGGVRFTNTNTRLLEEFSADVHAFGAVTVRAERMSGVRAPTLTVVGDPAFIAEHRQDFARRLRAAIDATGQRDGAVALALGVSPSLVCQWLQGTCVPGAERFAALCEHLGVAPDALAPHGLAAISRNSRHPLALWLEGHGLAGKNAHDKVVPPAVFTLPREQLALFLNRLFATDGWASVLASGQSQLGYCTVSRRLARQVQHLLLRFGVIAALKERTIAARGGPRTAWQLDITDADSIRTFATEIGIFGKEARLERVLVALAGREQHVNRDVVPAEAWQAVGSAKGSESWSSLARRAGFASTTNLHVGRRGLSRRRLGALANALGDSGLAQLADSDVYWDEVVAIEPLGLKQVYDLTIPETHNFVADDVCVHNTSFVLNITANAAIATRKPVLFFSLEMPRIELANRLMCAEAGVDQARLRSNMLTQDDMMALTNAASKLFSLPIYIDDSGDLTLLELRAKSRRIKNERDLSLIIIDYLQLMRASRDGMESREREISEISRGLKSLAKELEVPIVALSQLNRGPESRSGKDKRPQLSDLRESGAIEQDADNVMFIYRDEVYNKDTEDRGIAEIIVAKQRNGPTDTVRLRFIRELTKFDNLAEDHHEYGDAAVRGVEDAGGEEFRG